MVDIIRRSGDFVERGRTVIDSRLDELSEVTQDAIAKDPKVTAAAAFVGVFAAAFYGGKELGYAIFPHGYALLPHVRPYFEQLPFMSAALATCLATMVYLSASGMKGFRELGLEKGVLREFKLRFGNKRQISSSGVLRFIADHKLLFSLTCIPAVELAHFGSFFTDAVAASSPNSIYDLDFASYFNYAFDKTVRVLQRQPPLTYAVYGLLGYATSLLVSTGLSWLNTDLSLRALFNMFISKVTKNPSHLTDCLERILEHHPSKFFRYMLAHTYLQSGRVDDGLRHIAASLDNDEPLGFEGVPFVGFIRTSVKDAYLNIRKGTMTQASYIELAYLCNLIGADEKSEEVVSWMVEKFQRPDEYWLASLFFHKTGNTASRNRYLETVLPMLYADPVKFRREPLGEKTHANDVFRITHPLLEDAVVFKTGKDEAALWFEYRRVEEAGRLLAGHNNYSVPEPLFIGDFGGRPVYVMSQIQGRTLDDLLASGEAGLGEVMAAWELTEILHRGISPEVSRLIRSPFHVKLRASMMRIGIPRKIIGRILSCADDVEYMLSKYGTVFNTDGTPKNRIIRAKMTSCIDLEDKGPVYTPLEMAGLVRWRRFPHTEEIERGFLEATHMQPVDYWAAVWGKALSLYCFFSTPEAAAMQTYAPEKLDEAIKAIERVRDGTPMAVSSGSRIRRYNDSIGGLRELAELRHAA
ncbi:MAG: hypothetical protein HYU02_01635 [Thaumarchaeota archaeon]|nr:hypothetical protein [Nitrososphaerota archaeon]